MLSRKFYPVFWLNEFPVLRCASNLSLLFYSEFVENHQQFIKLLVRTKEKLKCPDYYPLKAQTIKYSLNLLLTLH